MDRLNTNHVLASGPRTAKICFVGKAPGDEENSFLEPFVGSAGQFFRRVLAKKRMAWSDMLVTNTFSQKPPKNDIEYYYTDKKQTQLTWEGEEHVARLRVWLEELLEQRESSGQGPFVLVALGRTAMYHLTGKKRVYKWRGSVLPCTLVPGFKVYVTLHPSEVMKSLGEEKVKLLGQKKDRAMNALPLFEIDMDRVLMQSETISYSPPKRVFDIGLSFTELTLRLQEIIDTKPELVACDIETLQGARGPVIWCIGFATAPDYAFVVPILRGGRFAWPLEDEAKLWRLISQVFLEEKIRKVFQGGLYDLAILGRYYGLRVAKGTYEDTMYCHHASYPYLWKSLEVLCSIYTWEPYYKDEGRISLGSRSDEGEFAYNAKDCAVTREIFPTTTRNAKELGTYLGYRRTMNILPSHLGMTIRGIRVDQQRKEELSKEFLQRATECVALITKMTGQSWNMNSPADKTKLLYGYLGLEIQLQRGTRKPTTDKNALNKLQRKYRGRDEGLIVSAILDYQKLFKLHATYTEMRLDPDGRLRTSYSLISTWRMNSSSSPFGGWTKEDREGGNLQNIPGRSEEGKMVRSLFIPDDGYVFLASDRRQAEAMVVAWLAQDNEKIYAFRHGDDVHWMNAKLVFGIPVKTPYDPKALWKNSITGEEHTFKEYRIIGKTIVHAGNYGMGPFKLQEVLALQGYIVEFRECKAFLEKLKATNPRLLNWQQNVRAEVSTTRTLITPLGRKRQFLGRLDQNLFNAAYAFVPQSTVGELTEITIQRIWEQIPEFQLLMNIHDEAFGQCKEEDMPKIIEKITEVSHYPMMIEGQELDIPVDFKWSPKNWGEMIEL